MGKRKDRRILLGVDVVRTSDPPEWIIGSPLSGGRWLFLCRGSINYFDPLLHQKIVVERYTTEQAALRLETIRWSLSQPGSIPHSEQLGKLSRHSFADFLDSTRGPSVEYRLIDSIDDGVQLDEEYHAKKRADLKNIDRMRSIFKEK